MNIVKRELLYLRYAPATFYVSLILTAIIVPIYKFSNLSFNDFIQYELLMFLIVRSYPSSVKSKLERLKKMGQTYEGKNDERQ